MTPVDQGGVSLSRRAFVLIWLSLAAIIIGTHYQFFFVDLHTEIGDFAANALQIRNAKFFHELYGNYSRFGFHHPGPGFFYLYAMGERVFHDLLHVVPSEFNAHVLTGVLIQTGFFVWSLAIIHRWIRSAALVGALLVLGAIHFAMVNHTAIEHSVFLSIWPPHVLLFPFVCFVVASASFAAGAIRDLLPAVVSACLLVHGHVAQPLFVVPIFGLALAGFAWQQRGQVVPLKTQLRTNWLICLSAVLVLAVAMVPLVIDVSKGAESNFHAILNHLTHHQEERNTLGQSVLYFAHFAAYEPYPERYCDHLDANSFTALKERWYFVITWLIVWLGSLAAVWCVRKEARFIRWLFGLVLLAGILSIYWGKLQTGSMLAFNSHFNYGWLFLVLVTLLLPFARFLKQRADKQLAIACLFLAAPLFVGTAKGWYFNSQPPVIANNTTVIPELAAAARQSAGYKKYLFFQRGDWGWAAGVAIALERLGYDFAVDPDSRFEFGFDKAEPIEQAVAERLPIWRLVPTTAKASGIALVPGDRRLMTSSEVAGPGADIDFSSQGNAQLYALFGWDFGPEPLPWTTKPTAVMQFTPQATTSDVEMSVDLIPAILPRLPAQRVEISFGAAPPAVYKTTEASTIVMRVPAAVWNSSEPITLKFSFPDATSPLAAGNSSDPRTLGCIFRSIKFRAVAP